MDVERFRDLYRFNSWANGAVLNAVTNLAPDQWTRDLGNSFPSVRDTLVHTMWAEWIWLERWKGTSPKLVFDAREFPTPAILRAEWRDLQKEQNEFLAGLTEEGLGRVLEYVNTRGGRFAYPLWQMMQHVVNHSTYHRGQITTMFRQLGATPVATDFLIFYDVIAESKRA